MSIEVSDRRTPPAVMATGSSAPSQPDDGDRVFVQPLTTYLEGSEHVGPDSAPYPIPRHQANELVANGIARIVDGPVTAAVDRVSADTPVSVSAVPALSGAAPAAPAETLSNVARAPGKKS